MWTAQFLSFLYYVLRKLRLHRILHFHSSKHQFTDYFRGFEKNPAIRKIFGERTEETLAELEVEYTWFRSYMWISDEDGHLIVSADYLSNGDLIDIYLDIIHELVHIRQYKEGKDLFDSSNSYVNRSTEVEAYSYAIEEARKLGLSDERILKHLKTEWINEDDLKILAEKLGVKYSKAITQQKTEYSKIKPPIRRIKQVS